MSFLSKLLTQVLCCCLFSHAVSTFQITGAGGGPHSTTQPRPFRFEINDFSTSGPSFDLFIQALNILHRKDQSDPFSYFQIAGIHGHPNIPWDGVIGHSPAGPGYCMHSASPFPPWHRPYLALYEQLIWETAQPIAASYPNETREVYKAAALNLRIPFWDWAQYPALPDVVQGPSIVIVTPEGPEQVENPLYDYNFQHDAAGNGFPSHIPYVNFPYTVRNWEESVKKSNQTNATATMLANAAMIVTLTYQLLTQVTDYNIFSCFTCGGPVNIESLHGNIHNYIGGHGHMTYPELSAFDPIFWLHHAQVDRLFAIWQALNPGYFMVPTQNAFGTYYEFPGAINSGNSTLAPFHSDNGTTLFTNNDVRSTAVFNYAYPDVPDWSMNRTQLLEHARILVNTKYNPAISQRRRRSSIRPTTRSPSLTAAFSNIGLLEATELGVNNAELQWFVKIELDRYAYNTTFALDFFMGDPPSDIESWARAPNLIGTHGHFIATNMASSSSYGPPMMPGQAEIPLTHTLLAGANRGYLSDLNANQVVPVLRQALAWRARTPDDQEIEISQLTGLSISIGSRRTVPSTSLNRFPIYKEVTWHPSVTEGRLGGASCRGP